MNIKEELTCKCCNQIYQNPINLICCGDKACRHHIEELISNSSSNKFTCPLCNQENSNQNFHIDKLLVKLIEKELHNFELDPKYEIILNSLKTEIGNLETILKDPENYIYEEIAELKRQVDLDREKIKLQIDELANDLIRQLDAYEARFRAEYKSNVDLEHYNALVELSKKQLEEYEHCLSLFSAKKEVRDEKCGQSEILIDHLLPKIKELENNLFSNLSFIYTPIENSIEDMFGHLIINYHKNKQKISGIVKNEFKGHALSLAILPNGDLASGTDSLIKIWNINDGTVKQTLADHKNYIWDLIVDNNCLFSACDDKKIKIWNIEDGTVKRTLTDHSERVLALKMIKDGELASGSGDSSIKIWNIEDGDLVSGSHDGTIKIWNVEAGVVKKEIKVNSRVNAFQVLENGDFVSASEKSIIIWN